MPAIDHSLKGGSDPELGHDLIAISQLIMSK